MWMMYSNTPTKEEQEAKAKQEQVEKVKEEAVAKTTTIEPSTTAPVVVGNDSVQQAQLKGQLGSFAYSAALPSANGGVTELKSELLTLKIANKGGYIVSAVVNGFDQFYKDSNKTIDLIKDNNSHLNLTINTADNRTLNTKDLFFEPTLSKEGENQVLTMRLKASETQYLEYRYVLKPNDYMMDFAIRSQGLNTVVNSTKPADLEWQLKAYRNEKSISYENRYTELVFEYEDGKDDYLSAAKDDDDVVNNVTYVAFKQHLFTSILLTDTAFKTATLKSENLVHDEAIDTVFTKNYVANFPLEFKNGELNYNMNMYYGPSKYDILNGYERNLDEIMPLGWGIFGWINRYVFIPTFGVISGFLPYGLAIIFFTILVRIVMSPVTYKSYVSQAKMKVLRPEIAELNEKYKDNAMKKQQETMKLYSKAGVNPMAGCLPALMQMPVFYALFQFFPSMFDLRQQGFLWADDLSSFDAVYQLPFTIPFYGNHVSLFPILASVAIFFYMKMTTGDQAAMSAPPQDGMPDMSKIMKMMLYISPLMMLFFFNNYASGLSLYYFVSNLITIGIMLVIKNYIVKEDKILARINENKTKEKKENKFQKKMREMMEQAEEQKAKQNKK